MICEKINHFIHMATRPFHNSPGYKSNRLNGSRINSPVSTSPNIHK